VVIRHLLQRYLSSLLS